MQRERSFPTRREADQFVADQTRARRYGHDVNLIAAKESFNGAVESYLATAPFTNEGTRTNYMSVYRKWVKPGSSAHCQAVRQSTAPAGLFES
jgi:hypothetical protein